MDKPTPPIFNQHRRKRSILWALTLLGWLMSVLFGEGDAHGRRLKQRLHHICLRTLTRATVALLVDRAMQFMKQRRRRRSCAPKWRPGPPMLRTHFMRSLLGARFRRLLMHKDLRTRIAQLIAVLRNLDAHARRLMRRMQKLNKLWRIVPPVAPCAPLLGPPAPSPALADSS